MHTFPLPVILETNGSGHNSVDTNKNFSQDENKYY